MTRGREGARSLALTVSLGALSVALWAAGAIAMLGRGVDLTDESFYLLSYRWWDEVTMTPTGVQYILGPFFGVTGHSVPALRLLRLLMVLLVHLGFAAAFVAWLRLRLGEHVRQAWAWSAVLMIVGAAGVSYGWTPLSPGYNDVTLWGSVAVTAVCIRLVTLAEIDGRISARYAVILGALGALMILAKWASAVVVILVGGVLLVVALASARAKGWARLVGGVVVGAAAVGLVTHVLVMPLDEMVPPMMRVNGRVAGSTNSPLALISMYARTSAVLLAGTILVAASVLLSVGCAAMVQRRTPGIARFVAAAAAPIVVATVFCASGTLPWGGVDRTASYTQVLLGLSATVLALWGLQARRRPFVLNGQMLSVLCVVVLCAAMPAAQALGTGNPLFYLAINAFALWFALMIAACWALPVRNLAGVAVRSVTASALVVCSSTGLFGLVVHPYRTAGFSTSTHQGTDRGPLEDIRMSSEEASRLGAVLDKLGAQSTVERPMMVFDEIPGLILALDGRPVGEAWFSAIDDARSAAGIEDACREELPGFPILFFTRAPTPADVDALNSCGVDLVGGYSPVVVDGWNPTLTMYLPKSGEGTSP
jgi:hypothetical protein